MAATQPSRDPSEDRSAGLNFGMFAWSPARAMLNVPVVVGRRAVSSVGRRPAATIGRPPDVVTDARRVHKPWSPSDTQQYHESMQPSEVSTFESYVSSVEHRAVSAMGIAPVGQSTQVPPDLLDGQAGAALRETIPLKARRQRGAFFSSSALRTAALSAGPGQAESGGPILDPAAGAGDLLIEGAKALPIDRDLSQTLHLWGGLLYGRDIEPAFVRLTKARLVLLAVARGAAMVGGTQPPSLAELLPRIQVGDGLDLLRSAPPATHIVMNPPFTYQPAAPETKWASGRTNHAAIFLAAAVEGARPGTRLTAILPDVIRTGSRYERLRSHIEGRLRVSSIEAYGRFDRWTDIDVFVLSGVVTDGLADPPSAQWWQQPSGKRVGDRFDVHVGPVVPHRDVQSGPSRPFLHARTIPLGGEFDVSTAERRGFSRRPFGPPFVVVRRTSRPNDGSRGLGTIIVGLEDVLVENHLIVLKPQDDSLDSCRQLVRLLDSSLTKRWLNSRIRCRHLTVRALREMPWWD